jgi:protein-disulfide isomerase
MCRYFSHPPNDISRILLENATFRLANAGAQSHFASNQLCIIWHLNSIQLTSNDTANYGGIRSGVDCTPTFFINGVRYDDSDDFDTLYYALQNIIYYENSTTERPIRQLR